jgi:DNA-binding NarL/FixJ family response regulator
MVGDANVFRRYATRVPDPLRVTIIEDQLEILDGLRVLIDTTPGYRCTAAFASMERALAGISATTRGSTDVVLVDLGLPGMSGIEGIRALRALDPQLRLVVLTVYEDDDRIFDALCAGASGYLLKKTPPAQLLAFLLEVMDGGTPMSPQVASRVVSLFREFRPPSHADYALTPHEIRLLTLLAEGHSYKTAAATLKGSSNTVAFHMKNIYRKLQVHSKSEAVAKALRHRIVR